ncbi:16S rRNA m(4)C1402 methyltransferase [Nitritalea halalkaliphila LW7]|uniref:Ribosomal RNA small subunit methyltransferase H n=1 Tax=Nitritalea halalkaliphila LW7 TaxID=1189621 RepID=I5C2D0_9BACT|nr:16S rRNA (cytosine(1402)-N(4))-methyltransferase RsmH [Nitritalea halalkaliphila]EIM75982.1 16S rRNA m(4)C1402 methyltransferase [Nitritalea halalkaliphila LW7]
MYGWLGYTPSGLYVDVTFGGGGHSRALLERLDGGHLYAFDQDPDAVKNSPEDARFTLIEANFRDIKKYLRLYGVRQVDGLLADLGISSHQIDEPERGFSTRFEGPLDMRMSQQGALTAAQVLNTYEEGQLHRLFGIYGEVKNAKTLAQAIVARRADRPFGDSAEFKAFLERFAPRGKQFKYYAQVYQALRIEVNDEMGALEELLLACTDLIKPGGRLVVMSYHSLEDRLVKHFMAKGKFHGEVEKDFYGNLQRPFDPVLRKAQTADAAELAANNRARSAKLRVAERRADG